MTRQEEKQQLRAIVRRLEAALAPEYKAKSARSIAHRLLAMPEYQEAQTVFCFVGTDREIDTRPILENALAAGKTLCVPLCTEPGRMESRQITDLNQLVPGHYGLLEPTADTPVIPVDAIDFAVLPCVTCNYLGQRLGHGGGYYDRFLSQYRGGTVLLCRELLIRQEIPVEPHDYPVPRALTERGKAPMAAGVDISKIAADQAAKAHKGIQFAVGSVFHLPVLEASCDLAMNLFAPLCAGEILRVLKPGGVFLLGVPDRRHLWQLKQAVYREPYENELKEPELPGFSLLEDYPVKDWLLLDNNEDIQNLFQMTPYYYKTSRQDQERAERLETLKTQVEFRVFVYRKQGA